MTAMDFEQLPLRDIHLPDALSWWPPAPGWSVVVLLPLVALAALLFLRHAMRHRSAALRELHRILRAIEHGEQPLACVQQVSAVLRRFAMTAARDPAAVAGLTGRRWLEYLQAHGRAAGLAADHGHALANAPYMPPEDVDAEQARALVHAGMDWVRSHRPGR